ncbi:site-specific DNA-methyltransferase [Microbacterium aerolatum]|uniref:Adenine methyltransferase n=1 Tax=Microbacterium aerolatum TaxID=153731 RepID=A0A511AHQ6_9MICO|nr:site-specific DNA-methyltransferase [Microbacterium aerolatum]GEK87724.1 adenine methyltransferase [Microbacterium aerolatum]GGB33824.1 adenine methyltransferase [Microbacterium aerolatum]
MPETPSTTPHFQTELAAQLADLIPEAIADGKIDLEKLKELLQDDAADSSERFGLFWPGKTRALRAAQAPTAATLRPDFQNSMDWDTTKNVFIEGDNLEVLKILQKHYHAKIKMIYIDPPYNTGKDFVYPDNYREGLQTYLEYAGQLDESGKAKSTSSRNTAENPQYHSAWLSMMYPRLKLARNLLTEDGVILISINDVEQAQLHRLCDEVFGESNLISQFVWLNEGNVDQQSKVKGVHEYVLAYSRNASKFARPSVIDPNITEDSKLFKDVIENSITKNGPANPASTIELPIGFPANFDSGAIAQRDNAFPHILDAINVAEGKVSAPARVRSGWSSRNLLDLFIRNGCVPIEDGEGRETWFELRDTGAIYMMKRRSDDQGHVLSVLRNLGTTKQNSSMLASWGLKFSYPKPVGLIEYLVSVFTKPKENAVVLDFFSGSATTAHAVMAANLRDGGNRAHLQVQLPEPVEGGDGATIADLARRRIGAAAEVISSSRVDQLQVEAADRVDVGFRSYRLTDTNFSKWKVSSDVDRTELEQHLFDLRESSNGNDATADDLLVEILLKQGYSLTEQVAPVDVAGLELRSVGGGVVLAYLNKHVKPTLEQLRAVVDEEPVRLVVLEDALKGDDELKTNLAQLCKSKGIEFWTA